MKLRPMATFNANGVLKGNIIAVEDDGTPLGWECNGDWSRLTFRDKAAKNLAATTGITEDRARAAVAQAIKEARRAADGADDVPAEEPATIRARLPGLVDLVDADGRAAYLFVSGGKLRVEDRAIVDGAIYVPPQGDLLIPVRPLPRYAEVVRYYAGTSNADLFKALVEWSRKASNLGPSWRYELVGLWVPHSWLADVAAYTPYLIFYSRDGERGKSRQGKAIAYVSYRGMVTETMQEANLFRWADAFGNTIFFDVMDIWHKAERKGAEDLLLGRFDRHGAKVARVLDPKLGPFADTRYFDVYGPTVIATNVAPNDLLQSRSIIITPPEASGVYPNLTPADGLALKEMCCAFRARHLEAGLPAADKPCEGRLGDILQPLAQVAELVGIDIKAIVAELKAERRNAAAESPDAALIEAVVKCLEAGQMAGDRLPISAVATVLNEGKPEREHTTSEKVGRRLTGLGFRGAPRLSGGVRARTIDGELLAGLCRKFGIEWHPAGKVKNDPGAEPSQPSLPSLQSWPIRDSKSDGSPLLSQENSDGSSYCHSTVPSWPQAKSDSMTVVTVAGKPPRNENLETCHALGGVRGTDDKPASCSFCGKGPVHVFTGSGRPLCEKCYAANGGLL